MPSVALAGAALAGAALASAALRVPRKRAVLARRVGVPTRDRAAFATL